jgi:hypothetical protein
MVFAGNGIVSGLPRTRQVIAGSGVVSVIGICTKISYRVLTFSTTNRCPQSPLDVAYETQFQR